MEMAGKREKDCWNLVRIEDVSGREDEKGRKRNSGDEGRDDLNTWLT